MCIVRESGLEVTGFSCIICRMSIKGSNEVTCDPLVAEVDGELMTVCERCAEQRFTKREFKALRHLSHPDFDEYRRRKLATCCDQFGVSVEFCKILKRGIESAERELIVV